MSADEGTGTMCSRSRRHGQAQSPSKASGTREADIVPQSAPPILLGAVAIHGAGLRFGGLLRRSGSASSGAPAAGTQSTSDISQTQALPAFPMKRDDGESLLAVRGFIDGKYSKIGPGTDTLLPPGMEE
jgi:hypothetical protein